MGFGEPIERDFCVETGAGLCQATQSGAKSKTEKDGKLAGAAQVKKDKCKFGRLSRIGGEQRSGATEAKSNVRVFVPLPFLRQRRETSGTSD